MTEQDERRAAERVVEDESLAADLPDALARPLLRRGAERARTVVQETDGDPAARRARLLALRRALARLARLARRRRSGPSPDRGGADDAP